LLRKASKALKEKSKKWQNYTRAYLVLGIGVNIGMATYLEVYVFHSVSDMRKKELLSCTSNIWITSNINYMLMAAIFVIFACKLN
jgi:hypothetical protein